MEALHNDGVLCRRTWLCSKFKIFRTFVVLLSSLGMCYVCYLSSSRYIRSMTQTVVERTDVHVSEIPFPAVTMCPVKGATRKLVDEAVQRFIGKNATDEEVANLKNLMKNFSMLLVPNEERSASHEMRSTHLDYMDLQQMMMNLSYDCEDFFEECHWRRVRFDCCKDLFRKQLAFHSTCFSFNSKTTLDPEPTWPWRVSEAGKMSGLKVSLKSHNFTKGLKRELIALMIHDPEEMPSTNIVYFGADRIIAVLDPLRFIADPDVRTVSPKTRRCYFTDENTKRSCISECRQRYFEQQCVCTPPWFATKNLRPCEIRDFPCIFVHKHAMITNGKIIHPYVNGSETRVFDCECYPNCNYVQYKTHVHPEQTVEHNYDVIEVQIYFQHDTLFSYRTGLVFTLLDLIVSFGGVAGLFLGFSMVGIVDTVERIYKVRMASKFGDSKRDKLDNSISPEKFTKIADNQSDS